VGRSDRALSAVRRLPLTLDRWINTERCRNYSIILIVLGYGLIIVSTFLGHLPSTAFGESVLPDYLAHWTGGRLVLDGQLANLYDQRAQFQVQTATIGQTSKLAWFVSPPFVGLLYAPLAALPYLASAGVWTLLSAVMLLTAMKLARPLAPTISDARWRMIVLVCFASQPVLELLGSGQDSAFSLLVWVAGTRLILARRDVLAGVVFALGLCKPQLFVLVPVVLVVQRRFRTLVAWLSTASVLALISVSMVGVDGVQNWLMLPFGDAYREAVQVGQSWKMQGLPSLITSLMPPQLGQGAEVVGLLAAVIILVLFVNDCRRWLSPRGDVGMWAFAALTTVLASPHLVVYDLVLLLPSVLYLVERQDTATVRVSLFALFVITWLAPIGHLLSMDVPWPLSVVGAGWGAIPILVLWRVFRNSAWLTGGQGIPQPVAEPGT
jgi:hypothetical protein